MRQATQVLIALTGVAVVGIALAHLILGGAAVIGGSLAQCNRRGRAPLLRRPVSLFRAQLPVVRPGHRDQTTAAQSACRSIPSRRPGPADVDHHVRTTQRLLFGDGRHRVGPPDRHLLPRVAVAAISLRANCFRSVNERTRSEVMIFKKALHSSALAAGVGLAGCSAAASQTATAEPGPLCNSPNRPPCSQSPHNDWQARASRSDRPPRRASAPLLPAPRPRPDRPATPLATRRGAGSQVMLHQDRGAHRADRLAPRRRG